MSEDLIKRVADAYAANLLANDCRLDTVGAMKAALAECGAVIEQGWQPIEAKPGHWILWVPGWLRSRACRCEEGFRGIVWSVGASEPLEPHSRLVREGAMMRPLPASPKREGGE